MRAKYARFGRRLGREGDPVLQSGVRRLLMLYTLPYGKVNFNDWRCIVGCRHEGVIF